MGGQFLDLIVLLQKSLQILFALGQQGGVLVLLLNDCLHGFIGRASGADVEKSACDRLFFCYDCKAADDVPRLGFAVFFGGFCVVPFKFPMQGSVHRAGYVQQALCGKTAGAFKLFTDLPGLLGA